MYVRVPCLAHEYIYRSINKHFSFFFLAGDFCLCQQAPTVVQRQLVTFGVLFPGIYDWYHGSWNGRLFEEADHSVKSATRSTMYVPGCCKLPGYKWKRKRVPIVLAMCGSYGIL